MSMREYVIGLQHFANGANTVVNFAGNDDATKAGSMNANDYHSGDGDGALSAEMKTFYDKTLIELAGPKLVHDQFAVKRPIPRHGGKTIEWRKFSKLPKATQPITEGVTPAGNKLSVSAVTATVEQYGDYVEQTDLLELTAIDNTIVEATKKLADQAGVTMDTIVRDQIHAGSAVMYSNKRSGDSLIPVTERGEITKMCPLTVDDVFLAATELRAVDAPTFDGYYHAIIHPHVANSLMREADKEWMDIHKYADPENIYRGEIGMLGGVRFFSTSEAKIYGPAVIRDGKTRLKVAADASSAATTVYVEGSLTTGSGLSIPCYINGVSNTITAIAAGTSEHAGQSALTVTGLSANLSKGTYVILRSTDSPEIQYCGKDGSAVYGTLFFGQGAYGSTDLEGGGLEHIVKQRGYGNDPLNQRSSIGWKATKVAKVLIPEYIIRFESGSEKFSMKAESN